MLCRFFLMKFKKFCIYIGPYALAFNDPEVKFYESEEEDE